MKTHGGRDEIKCAVVGYGGAFDMGRKHLEQMRGAGMTPHAAADLAEDRLKVAEEDFPGIRTYTAVEEMLADAAPDLVAVITPHNTHADIAVQCLEAGASVVVEKPMAITTAECDRMIAAARANDLLLSTFHNRHWDGCAMRAVEQVCEEGVVGDVYRIEAHMGGYRGPREWWRSSRSISGGILYDWGVHLLEYSLQLMEGGLAEVSGFAHTGFWQDESPWGEDTIEDEAYLVARFDTGRWLSLTMSALDSYPKGVERKWVEVTGTKGTYLFDGGSWKTILQTEDGAVTEEGENPEGAQHRYYENVAAALVGEEDPIITPEWARRPIHILDLGVRSAKEGRALPAEYA